MAFRSAASGLCGLAAGGVWVATYKPYAEAFWGGKKKEEAKEVAAAKGAVHPVNPENSVCAMDISVNGRTVGRIEMELYDDAVPKTTKNFRVLCSGAYDEWAKDNPLAESAPSGGLFSKLFGGGGAPPAGVGYNLCPIHRIIPGFMAQMGDFTHGNGSGGRSIYGAKFPDEGFEGKAFIHQRGALSMANAGPNTNGSQFFICFDETSWLNGKHVVFGQVLKGMDVVEVLQRAGSRSGTPTAECQIERAYVLKKPSGSLADLAQDEKYAAVDA